ncbi:MAG TPA: hypothetical protein VKB53_04850 [Gammaproteobacteria bacterium]|nr:hypothetical protein [Gammaproteobacteria bacterium]
MISKETYKSENLCAMVRTTHEKRSGPTCALNTMSTLDDQPSLERMTIMANHSSATVRETPHVNQTSRTNTIINALTERAQAVLNDRSIDAQSRAIIRCALEMNDPWLAEFVHRADAGETLVDSEGFLKISSTNEENVAALAEMICRGGDEAGTKSAALLVLMSTLENATHPKALAKLAKRLAFTRCRELNLNGMVEAQIAVFESEL